MKPTSSYCGQSFSAPLPQNACLHTFTVWSRLQWLLATPGVGAARGPDTTCPGLRHAEVVAAFLLIPLPLHSALTRLPRRLSGRRTVSQVCGWLSGHTERNVQNAYCREIL